MVRFYGENSITPPFGLNVIVTILTCQTAYKVMLLLIIVLAIISINKLALF